MGMENRIELSPVHDFGVEGIIIKISPCARFAANFMSTICNCAKKLHTKWGVGGRRSMQEWAANEPTRKVSRSWERN